MKLKAKNPAGGRQGRKYTPLLGVLRSCRGLSNAVAFAMGKPLAAATQPIPVKFKDRQLNRGVLFSMKSY